MAAYVASGGDFERDTDYITTRITPDGRDGYPVEPGRYRLIVARACPWANRAIIVRRLLGLEPVLSIGFCGPTHDERSWTFDLDPGGVDPVLKIPRLQDAYFKRIPNYPKGITVPAIVDVPTGRVVTNDFAQITLDLSTEWGAYHRDGAPHLYPEPLRAEIDDVAQRIYTEINDGVYRCGFAGSRAPTTKRTTGCSPRSTGYPNTERPKVFGGGHHHRGRRAAVHHAGPFRPGLPRDCKCNRAKLSEMPVLSGLRADLSRRRASATPSTSSRSRRHCCIATKTSTRRDTSRRVRTFRPG